MGYKRKIAWNALCAAMLGGIAGASSGAPREPLIVTRLSNPDSDVAAAAEPRLELIRLHSDDEETAVDEAIATFGRAIGQAAVADRQALEAKCRSSASSVASSADRFAWAVNCRYARH